MARHHHHHRHHGNLLPSEDSAPLFQAQPVQLRQILNVPSSHARSLFIRTPPGVSSSSSGSSDSNTGSSSDSSSDTTDTSDSSGSDTSTSSSSGGSPSSSSSSGGHSGTNISIPVALGVIVPILLAVVLFVYLHRRHVRKLRQEDANDPHKSLDFGWDPTTKVKTNKRGKSKKGKPDVTIDEIGMEKNPRKDRGLSMDLDVGSPYLMPPGLHGSRESLHSMSRTIHSQDDRYRPATTYNSGDAASLHSQKTKRGGDDSSSHGGSASTKQGRDDMKQELLGNAQRMSRSIPPVNRSPIPEIQMPQNSEEVPRTPIPPNPAFPLNGGLAPNVGNMDARESYQPNEHVRTSNNYLAAFIHSREPSADVKSPETERSEYLTPREAPATPSSAVPELDHPKSPLAKNSLSTESARPSRHQSLQSSQHASIEHHYHDDASDYGETFKVTPASPRMSAQDQTSPNRGSSQEYMPPIDEYSLGINENDFGYDVRRLSMGVRPLPPEDPTDNPEQRANRIRSFYKEYFDDSKQPRGGADYYEDYDENYLGDGAIFDPTTGQYVTAHSVPYAEHYERRAMTPPPRVGGRRHAATMSGGSRLMPPGPRAFSSVSGRFGASGRPPPKKKQPPPKALRVLPTPHLLKEDDIALPIEFAPPTSAKGQRVGIADSPRGGLRPYSPAVRPHTPLARSYDDLAVMPSPHLLRKSGTFTALDFAPPPRFKNADTASDAGSIRSNRSGMSARTQHAVRTGAYRISRIPKEVVGTKGDLMDSLKPQWNMHNNTGTIGMPSK